MPEAVGYTRLSEDGLSIPKQKEQIRTYCERESLPLREIYDDGERASGYGTDDRPAYKRLREQVRTGAVAAVVVRDVDRIGRDFDERLRFVLDCREQKVELHSTEAGQRDLSDPYSFVVETAQAASSDVQKRREIDRAKAETKRRIENGCYHGRVPIGVEFADDSCHLEKSDRWDVLEQVWDRRASGEQVTSVASDLGIAEATVSRVANRGLSYYRELLEQYGTE